MIKRVSPASNDYRVRWSSARRNPIVMRRYRALAVLPILFALACGDDPIPPPGTDEGRVEVTITGMTAGGTSGGQLRVVVGTGEGIVSLPAPAGGISFGVANVPIGTGEVTYRPPADYQLAAGEDSIRSVTVEEGDTIRLTWDVDPVAAGDIEVTVTGFATGATNGGSATAVGPGDTPIIIGLAPPSGGTATGGVQNVPSGSYSVTYTPPGDHVLAAGEPASRSTTVPSDGTGNVGWAVEPTDVPTGTINVTVNGFKPGAASAGSVSADPVAGDPVTISLGAPVGGSATGSAIVNTGSYVLTYSPPGDHVIQPGDSSTRNLSVTTGGTHDVTWAVDSTTAAGLDFENVWTTLGMTEAAVLGSGFQSVFGGGTNQLEIISKPGHWPSLSRGHVMEIEYSATPGGSRTVQAFPWVPFSNWESGEHRHLFFFYEVVDTGTFRDTRHNGVHGHEALDQPGGSANPWSMGRNNSDDLRLSRRFKENNSGSVTINFDSDISKPLDRGVVYQVEFVIRYMGGDTIRTYMRVWSGDGATLLLDTSDFLASSGGAPLLDYDLALGSTGATGLVGFQFGTNGGGEQKELWTERVADVRARTTNSLDWIGPIQ